MNFLGSEGLFLVKIDQGHSLKYDAQRLVHEYSIFELSSQLAGWTLASVSSAAVVGQKFGIVPVFCRGPVLCIVHQWL